MSLLHGFLEMFLNFTNLLFYMIGTVAQNNDIYVFFEGDDLQRLGKGEIKGTYINAHDSSIMGELEVKVDDVAAKMFGEAADFILKKDKKEVVTGLEGYLTRGVYKTLLERDVRMHLGFAHINLINCEKELSFHDRNNYEQLKIIRDKKAKS